MISYIFGIFIIIGVIYGYLTGNINTINDTLLVSGKTAIEMILNMIPLLCLWLGVMKIADASGLIDRVSKYISNIIHPIFPELKRDGKSISYIGTNIIMNMLGLGSGATPFGLKAMEELEKENSKKGVASRSMITFLVINTASVTIIPTTVISFRILNNSKDPSLIVPACIITTVLSLIIGLFIDRLCAYIWSCRYD